MKRKIVILLFLSLLIFPDALISQSGWFWPVTRISFSVPLNKGGEKGLFVKLVIFDILGREVNTLINEPLKPGVYEVNWEGTNYPSGVYFYQLRADEYVETRKMVLII
jgi:hypothetical protein